MTGHSRLRGRTRGGISKTAWSLLTGAVTMCINAEMHLSCETWDLFGPIDIVVEGKKHPIVEREFG